MKFAFELNDYYGYIWDYETIDDAQIKMEKMKERIDKYLVRYKKKELIAEHGCLNYKVLDAELTENYELKIYWDLNDRSLYTTITLKDVINKDYYFKYDRKYHTLQVGTL